MKSPAILFYTSDFLTGTTFMSNEEVGCYIRLLCYQHQKGHIKQKDMNNICLTLDKDSEVFSKFIEDKEGHFFNKRMEEEIQKRESYSKSRSENRRKSTISKGKSKNKDMNNICKTYEQHMGNENDNINDNININEDYITISKYMFSKIQGLNPNNKEPNFNSWADDFRKIIEIDKRNPNDIAKLINWIYLDNFWKCNILSPKKLREKYDQLMIKARNSNNFKTVEDIKQKVEEMAKYR